MIHNAIQTHCKALCGISARHRAHQRPAASQKRRGKGGTGFSSRRRPLVHPRLPRRPSRNVHIPTDGYHLSGRESMLHSQDRHRHQRPRRPHSSCVIPNRRCPMETLSLSSPTHWRQLSWRSSRPPRGEVHSKDARETSTTHRS
mgnify:CR=1 FL=1